MNTSPATYCSNTPLARFIENVPEMEMLLLENVKEELDFAASCSMKTGDLCFQSAVVVEKEEFVEKRLTKDGVLFPLPIHY